MKTLRPPRGKKSTAESENIVLEDGAVFFEVPENGSGTGYGNIKMGDGKTSYTDLPYFMKGEGASAGTATYATNAGTATYSKNAGTASYSSNSAKLSGYSLSKAGTNDVWGTIPSIGGSDGVMEVGKYIDFHVEDGSTTDKDVRIEATTSGLSITGTITSSFSGNLTGTASTANYVSYGRLSGSSVGTGSLAFGTSVTASGNYSQAFGYKTIASSTASHAEGTYTIANNDSCHVEGYATTASGDTSHAEGFYTSAFGAYSHAEGNQTQASGKESHVEGYKTVASSTATHAASHAEGYQTLVSGDCGAHAEGRATTASGNYGSHAEGDYTLASGNNGSHAEGYGTSASGNNSHAEGRYTTASGKYGSHAEGYGTSASGNNSHAEGRYTIALNHQHAQGHYNSTATATATDYNTGTNSGTAFVIGFGTPDSRANAFRVTYQGYVYAAQASMQTGADYAEFFEWNDGNSNNEDRVGYFVTFDEQKKIRIANKDDDYILGIVSGNPAVIGNADECWRGRYITDDFGRYIEETVTEEIIEIDEETGEEVTRTIEAIKWKEVPDYNPDEGYEQRLNRPEWDTIGMFGVLPVRDDGTCIEHGYCTVSDGGIATTCERNDSTNTYKVLQRVSDNVVEVLFR